MKACMKLSLSGKLRTNLILNLVLVARNEPKVCQDCYKLWSRHYPRSDFYLQSGLSLGGSVLDEG